MRAAVVVRCSGSTPQRADNAPAAAPAQPRPQRQPLIANRRQLFGFGLSAAACLCCPTPPPAAADAGWGYSCVGTPDKWGGACAEGIAQSPINLPYDPSRPGAIPAPDGKLPPLMPKFPRYLKDGLTVRNTGHGTMQVNIPDGAVEWELNGQPHRMLQFHFHSPSEHAFNGRHTAMECHLVHKNMVTGNLAVLGIMIEQDDSLLPNPAIAEALATAPKEMGKDVPLKTPISIRSLLPPPRNKEGHRPYANYPGSLTTPPCSTGVDWYVFLDSLAVEGQQIADFMFYAGQGNTLAMNARPKQPLVGRSVRYYL